MFEKRGYGCFHVMLNLKRNHAFKRKCHDACKHRRKNIIYRILSYEKSMIDDSTYIPYAL